MIDDALRQALTTPGFPKGDQIYTLMFWRFLEKLGVIKLETKRITHMMMLMGVSPNTIIPAGSYIMPITGSYIEYIYPVGRHDT